MLSGVASPNFRGGEQAKLYRLVQWCTSCQRICHMEDLPMWKIRHTMAIGWGRGGRLGGLWSGIGVPNPLTPTSCPLTPIFPTQPQLFRPYPNISPLCGKSSTSALLQTFDRRLHSNSQSHLYVSPVVWRIFCGESSGNWCTQDLARVEGTTRVMKIWSEGEPSAVGGEVGLGSELGMCRLIEIGIGKYWQFFENRRR